MSFKNLFKAAMVFSFVVIFAGRVHAKSTIVKTYNLQSSNMISLPINANINAKDFCDLDERITYIDSHIEYGVYDQYDCQTDEGVNFKMKPYVGYFVRTNGGSFSIDVEGTKMPFNFNKFKNSLFEGWQLVGIDVDNAMTAEDLCEIGSNLDDGLAIEQVYRWRNGRYDGHMCTTVHTSIPVSNNFDLTDTDGYFVHIINTNN